MPLVEATADSGPGRRRLGRHPGLGRPQEYTRGADRWVPACREVGAVSQAEGLGDELQIPGATQR